MTEECKDPLAARVAVLEALLEPLARIAVLEALLPSQIASVTKETDLKLQAAEKALMVKASADAQALTIQFNDTQRRLRELNGHHEEIKANQGNSVTKDKFDSLVSGDIADLKRFRDTSLGRQSVIAVVISAVIMLLGVLLQKLIL